MVFGLNTLGQIALRQRPEHPHDIVEAFIGGGHQLVQAASQIEKEALLTGRLDALGKVTGTGSGHQVGHFAFHRHFNRTVGPLHHRAQALTAGTDHRVGHQREGPPTDLDMGPVGAGEGRQQALLVLRILVELVDGATGQLGHVEVRQVFAQVALGVLQHRYHGLVHVDDVALVVGNHHVAADVIQSNLDPRVFRRQGLLTVTNGQFGGHVLPFHHHAQALTVGHDRVDDQVEAALPDHQPRLVGLLQAIQHAALMAGVLVEHVDIAAKNGLGVEARQIIADIALRFGEHVLQGMVGIDDVVAGIGHHDVGGGHIQGLTNALAFLGAALSVGELEAQTGLHPFQGQRHLRQLVIAVSLDDAVEIGLTKVLQVFLTGPQGCNQAPDQLPAIAQHQQGEQQAQPQQRPGLDINGETTDRRGQQAGERQQAELGPQSGTVQGARRQVELAQRAVLDPTPLANHPAPGRALAEAPVQLLGGTDLVTTRAGTHRHIADHRAAFAHGCGVGHHPIEVAILAAVLHQPGPGPSGFQGAPQVGKGLFRHVRMTDQVMRFTDQLGLGEAAGLDEVVVDVGDPALEVRARDNVHAVAQQVFLVGNRQVGTHA